MSHNRSTKTSANGYGYRYGYGYGYGYSYRYTQMQRQIQILLVHLMDLTVYVERVAITTFAVSKTFTTPATCNLPQQMGD